MVARAGPPPGPSTSGMGVMSVQSGDIEYEVDVVGGLGAMVVVD